MSCSADTRGMPNPGRMTRPRDLRNGPRGSQHPDATRNGDGRCRFWCRQADNNSDRACRAWRNLWDRVWWSLRSRGTSWTRPALKSTAGTAAASVWRASARAASVSIASWADDELKWNQISNNKLAHWRRLFRKLRESTLPSSISREIPSQETAWKRRNAYVRRYFIFSRRESFVNELSG